MLVVDEALAGFGNVEFLDVADVVVTSLTKSFSDVAKVMAGSVVFNPWSKLCSQLHVIIDATYRDSLCCRVLEFLK